jgi:hypothetical protein
MSLLSKMLSARQERRAAAADDARDAFWAWFRENTAFLETYAEDTPGVVGEIGERLNAVDPRLAFELGRADDGAYEFIVSADGIREVFPEVVALVKAAPAVPGWRIVAFRPRKPGSLGRTVRYGPVELGADALWYRASDQADRVALTLCVEGRDEDGARAMLGPIFLLLDATLGEYDVTTRIGAIEFAACPAQPVAAGLRPISDLAREVDARFDPVPA